MDHHPAAGIVGLSYVLPDRVLSNEHWSPSVVEGWRLRAARRLEALEDWAASAELTPHQRLVLEAIREQSADPFGGSRKRHVVDHDTPASTLEAEAGRRALDDAGIDPREVDLVLGYAGVPDFPTVPNACFSHQVLGLRRDVPALNLDAACNTFVQQLDQAALYIRAGRARVVLCVTSSLGARLMPPDAEYAPWFGEAATGVVVAAVPEGFGLLQASHFTDSSAYGAMVTRANDGPWYGDGPVRWQTGDAQASRRMLFDIADQASEAVGAALAACGHGPDEVDYFASHAGTGWLCPVTKRAAGLDGARTVNCFPRTASVTACNVPLSLAFGLEEGLLGHGDLVATFSGGSGTTYSATVMRWYDPRS